MVHSCPQKWAQWIPLAEFWYNTTYHSAHGHTPFEALYGHPPKHFGITASDACSVADLDDWLQARNTMMQHIQHNLARAQQRMQHQADKHRQERSFDVGDWVYVKLQPHIQQSIQHRSNQKLSYKYFEPYLILQTVAKVAYKLQLLATSQIHPVLHVSQLKKALPPDATLSKDAGALGNLGTSCFNIQADTQNTDQRDYYIARTRCNLRRRDCHGMGLMLSIMFGLH